MDRANHRGRKQQGRQGLKQQPPVVLSREEFARLIDSAAFPFHHHNLPAVRMIVQRTPQLRLRVRGRVRVEACREQIQ
jgi:hypothetical protein